MNTASAPHLAPGPNLARLRGFVQDLAALLEQQPDEATILRDGGVFPLLFWLGYVVLGCQTTVHALTRSAISSTCCTPMRWDVFPW